MRDGAVVWWIALLSVTVAFFWVWAVASAVRAKPHWWREAPGSRNVWVGLLVVVNVGQRFLPASALGIRTLAAALAYLLFVRPRLLHARDLQRHSHTRALGAIARDLDPQLRGERRSEE